MQPPTPPPPPAARRPSDPAVPAGPDWAGLARRLAWLSGGFSLVLVFLLGVNLFQGRTVDPMTSPRLTALKAELARNPSDEAKKREIRALDLRLRQQYTRYLVRAERGGWLLMGGLAVFIASLKGALYRKKLPAPGKYQLSVAAGVRAVSQARGTVAAMGLGVIAVGWGLSTQQQTVLKPPKAAVAGSAIPPAASAVIPIPAAPPATPFPTPEELRQNWPRFRGPGGLATAASTNAPATWDVKTGTGIVWKIPVPVVGPSSPIIWGNRLFLSGATAKKREVYCYDTASGSLVWQKAIESKADPNAEPPRVMEDTGGYAASTPATDGRRVYVMFATGDVAALDFQGNLVWSLNLGIPDNSYGHATSLETYQNRLLVQLDQGNGKDGKSKVYALDCLTGNTVWVTQPRPVPNSWASPLLVPTPKGEQLITSGNPWVIAYDPAQGTELWRAKALYGEVTPSPTFANGLVFTAIEGEKLSAIRTDGTGDVTKTHVVWSADEGLPDICSVLSDGARVYLLNSQGLLTCYDAASGKKLWDKEFELGFNSSPSLAGGRVYLISEKGVVIQVAAGPEFKELGRSELGEEVLSSPAFLGGRMYVRAKQHLFCIGAQ